MDNKDSVRRAEVIRKPLEGKLIQEHIPSSGSENSVAWDAGIVKDRKMFSKRSRRGRD